MSTMRYQSNGRGQHQGGIQQTPSMDPAMNHRARVRSDQMMGYSNGNSSGNNNNNHSNRTGSSSSSRPRAISAGRLRAPQQQQQQQQLHQNMNSQDDPSAVARQILDLRERRESTGKVGNQYSGHASSSTKRRGGIAQSLSMPSVVNTNHHPAAAVSSSSSPRGMMIKAAGSGLSEDIQAEQRLKKAENKISGLLQELEELKFFQEIEAEQPAPTTPRTPRTPAQSKPSASAGNAKNSANGLPMTIRAPSPQRGGRLPPPPPANQANFNNITTTSSKPKGGVETYRPLSPRSIAKLDRNSLELECQTLVRKLQLLEQEKNSHAATIEMYEISLQEHDADKAKIQRLDGELLKVSSELKKQLYNIQTGKEHLMNDYEERLQANLKKLHRTQEKADSYKADFETAKANAERFRVEMENARAIADEEKARAEELLTEEENIKMQLDEARNLNATLVKKVEKKRSEVSVLKEDLTNTNKLMEENSKDREEMYESRIAALEQQLSVSKDRYGRLEQECTDSNAAIVEKDNELNQARIEKSEQDQKIEDLFIQIDELQQQTEQRFEEGKRASKTMETRKVQELITERATAAGEYERRIKAMQEQLRHQSDRHNADIQETRVRNERKLEEMKHDLKEEIRMAEGDKVSKLECEMAKMKRHFEEEKMNHTSKLHESQQKAREASIEFQQQDQQRQQELDQLHERLNSYFNEIAERDNQIAELTEQLDGLQCLRAELEGTTKEQRQELERNRSELEQERAKLVEMENRLNDEIITMKSTHSELEQSTTFEMQALREQIKDSEKRQLESQESLKEKEVVQSHLVELQAAHDETKKDLLAERARLEATESETRVELAQLQGKLRASESSLASKKTRIEQLENQLDDATATTSKVGEEKQNQIASLRKQLDDVTNRLEIESSAVATKDSQIEELEMERRKLHDKLSDMSKLQDDIRDMERKLDDAESDKNDKRSELLNVKSDYEAMRSKLLDAEHRYSNLKEEFATRLEKKEKLLERYDNTIKDLEVDLQREKSDKSDMETEKARKQTELSSLRKDYEDLTGLLEENLHSSAMKDELDSLLKKKDYEMRETVDIYNRQFSELETKQREEIRSKEKEIKRLRMSLERVEEDKTRFRSELSEAKRSFQDVSRQLDDAISEKELSRGGIAADQGRKDRHMREAVQRYTRTIADLESKLEEENQARLEIEDRLESARSELEEKQNQTQELVQRHTKENIKLQSDLSKTSVERDQLKLDLEFAKKDMQKKANDLGETVARYKDEVSFLESATQDSNSYRGVSRSAHGELHTKERQIMELKKQIVDLKSDLDKKNRETVDLKSTSQRYESELAQRKDQLSDAVTNYSEKIADLEARLDERSPSRTTSRGMIDSADGDSSRKDSKIRELTRTVADLESKLETSRRQIDTAKLKAESLACDLDDKENELREYDVEKIETETKLHTLSRSKDELRAKVTELSSRLERKEREVREVSDRYKIYVTELESKLDQDTDAKHNLQMEIDKLRTSLNDANEVSSEASDLKQKVYSLEKSLESYKGKARESEERSSESFKSLNEQLKEATTSRDSIEEALKKATAEKAEVIAALEGVINEVQNREDEIESLSELLQRRDEELQHAKIIATKALQSAKDIQKRYKDKDQDRHSDLMDRMNDVSDNVDRLTTQNESLQLKIKSLERDLRDRNLECKRLKDQLRQIDGKSMLKDDVSAISTQSTYSMSHSGSINGARGTDGDHRLDPPMALNTESFSPSTSPRDGSDNFEAVFGNDGFPAVEKQLSVDSFDGSHAGSSAAHSSEGNRWATDFDNESAYSSKSRKSIERDALRKYVRSRYMKRGEKATF
ncbi:MAG: hypothetical protein SGILL_002230 [Bacillariaceae sp.]